MTALFETTGYIEGTLTAGVPIAEGTGYYLAYLSSFTGTVPTVAALNGANAFPPIRGNYPSVFETGQATVPATITPSGMTSNPGAYFMTAGV